MSEQGDNNEIVVDSLTTIKIPTYGACNPRIWFAQVKALFIARGVKSQAIKYAHVVAALPIEVATEVGDLIDEVPSENLYDKLKSAIIQRTAISDEKRLQQLLTDCELGDKKPSQLLRHIKQLAGTNQIFDEVLKQFWIQRLTFNARQILSTSVDSADSNTLSEMADKILEVYPSQSLVNKVEKIKIDDSIPNPSQEDE